ncbi:MAG: hypothetical protein K6U80_18265 [Firmicutes bacterium]|nr:hypothetical protein [Bacillota bacterium]
MRKIITILIVLVTFIISGLLIIKKEKFQDQAIQIKENQSYISNNLKQTSDYAINNQQIIDPDRSKEIIKDIAAVVIRLIKEKDFEKLSNYIHPELGVRFTPQTIVGDDDLVFSADEIKNFFNDNRIYEWGYAGASDDKKIRLTKAEYYNEFIYDKDFAASDHIGYNEILQETGFIENQYEKYPGSIIVEYYVPGDDGFDWATLRLVFQKYIDEKWYIVGIIHNTWTP